MSAESSVVRDAILKNELARKKIFDVLLHMKIVSVPTGLDKYGNNLISIYRSQSAPQSVKHSLEFIQRDVVSTTHIGSSLEIIYNGPSVPYNDLIEYNSGVVFVTHRFQKIDSMEERMKIADEALNSSGNKLYPEGSERRRKLIEEGKIFSQGVFNNQPLQESKAGGTHFIEREALNLFPTLTQGIIDDFNAKVSRETTGDINA